MDGLYTGVDVELVNVKGTAKAPAEMAAMRKETDTCMLKEVKNVSSVVGKLKDV